MNERAMTIEQKREQKQAEGFAKFMAQPTTKLMLSMVPSADNPDAMQTLLHSCFMAGCSCGSGEMAAIMIEAMLSSKKPER